VPEELTAPVQRSYARVVALVAAGVVLLALLLRYVVLAPADVFIATPDVAHPADEVVRVGNGTAPAHGRNGAGIYYLDVVFHRATVAEDWLAGFERGGTSVPVGQFLAPGASETDQLRSDRVDFESSKRLAAAVAFRALGRKVGISGGGVKVDAFTDTSSPAYRAGLRPGMVIVAVDGRPLRSILDLHAVVGRHRPGDTISLTVLDGAKRRTIPATLEAEKGHASTPVIGIFGEDVAPQVKLPEKVAIDIRNLGGPSAGLAFALEIYDRLTHRSLSRGRRIAVTGTVGLDGTVGPIGGVRQKAIAASAAGADLMLVPVANLAEARANAGGVRVVGVRTFDEAKKVLEER
jgi:PDZ domain-containing protein